MTDILLLVDIVLQLKILHNQRKATDPTLKRSLCG